MKESTVAHGDESVSLLERYWKGWISWGAAALALGQLSSGSAIAAERILFNYSILGRSISVRALETYARDGILTEDLVSYARFVNPKQMAQLREGLLQKVELSPVAVSQFLYSSPGELLLNRLSRLIQTRDGRGSFYALRSSLVLAAADPQGLTPLAILRQYPNSDVVVNVQEIVGLVDEVNRFLKQTDTVTQQIQTLSEAAPLSPAQRSILMQAKQSGPIEWQKFTLPFQDDTEKRLRYTRKVRQFAVDVYLPLTDRPRPLVVISHGLNSDRESYAYLAQHLASYGFAVAVPEHPGSNKQQLQSLLEGRGREVAEPIEFLDRPLDIQFLLDSLQSLAKTDERLQGRLDFDRAGIIGQSFGGYTSLAAAGAPLSFDNLLQNCGRELNTTLNISLALQCQALRLPSAQYQLADARIKAAIAINPIASGVFGPDSLAQIQVPVMVIAGSMDVVAPALPEQIQPFTQLKTLQRYLAVIQNSNHFSTIAPSSAEVEALPQIKGLEGPSPALAQSYVKVLSLLFMQRYLNSQQDNQILLSPAGAEALSQSPLPLSIVNALPDEGLVPDSVKPEDGEK
ncbi:alpha/beta hydrolase [Altericista sp. CCNU0014]|uniref:alpha/beta hydrolase n=1 Tax=Altericista sp. CCNU0014 TaxID=3082949 RepID=UPI00384C3B56